MISWCLWRQQKITWLVVTHKSDIMTSARAVIAWMFLDSKMNNVRLLNFLASFQSLLRQLTVWEKYIHFLMTTDRSLRYLLLIILSVNWSNLFYIIAIQFYSLHVFLLSLISPIELLKIEDCLLACFEWQLLDSFFDPTSTFSKDSYSSSPVAPV